MGVVCKQYLQEVGLDVYFKKDCSVAFSMFASDLDAAVMAW